MSYSYILTVIQTFFGHQTCQPVEDFQQQHELQELRQRLEILETERMAVQNMAQRQSVEIQELRRRLKHREEIINQLKACNRAGSEELQRTREQARLALIQHSAEINRFRQSLEEVRRAKLQVESCRPVRKVLPPRSLWQRSAVG